MLLICISAICTYIHAGMAIHLHYGFSCMHVSSTFFSWYVYMIYMIQCTHTYSTRVCTLYTHIYTVHKIQYTLHKIQHTTHAIKIK